MSLQGVVIKKGKIGANTLNAEDGVSGLIIAGNATPKLAHGVVATIYNLVDAELLGITAETDLVNKQNVYRHIREFYRIRGEGQLLYLMLVQVETKMSDIVENASYARKLLSEADGKIRQIAIAVNPTGVVTLLNGLPVFVYNAISKAQALYAWADSFFMPCQIILEGYAWSGNAATTANLRELEENYPNVSVVIGQDYEFAESLVDNQQKYADVGTALGTLSAAMVNQNIGDNEAFNLTNTLYDAWLTPGLSNHVTCVSVMTSLETLNSKGYIFGIKYIGIDGVRWNDDHTCTEIIVDAEGNVNEHTIAYGRTHDKARRLLRVALLPKVKSNQPVDPKTGKLPVGVVKNFEKIGDTVFSDMEKRKEISFGKCTVDPNSDLLVEKILKVKFRIIPYGNVGEIIGTSNLKTSL